MALPLPVKILANYVLHCYGPESDVTCVNYLDWGFNFATKIVVNTFFNNKQEILSVREVLLTFRNIKERNKQYLSLSCFHRSSQCELFLQNDVNQI